MLDVSEGMIRKKGGGRETESESSERDTRARASVPLLPEARWVPIGPRYFWQFQVFITHEKNGNFYRITSEFSGV